MAQTKASLDPPILTTRVKITFRETDGSVVEDGPLFDRRLYEWLSGRLSPGEEKRNEVRATWGA